MKIHNYTNNPDKRISFLSAINPNIKESKIKVPSGTVVVTHLFVKKK